MQPTQRQKQFLRALGHKDFDGLIKESASALIDRLLAEEKASGKKFPCPYCKEMFGPRPKRTKKCPHCGNKIIHLSGRFYNEDQVNEMKQKDDTRAQKQWLKESRQENRETVREDLKDEKSFRKEFGEPYFVGYLVQIGPQCVASAHLNGLLVLIDDAVNAIDLLPPYDECRHNTCECDFEPVTAQEVPKKARVAELVNPVRQAKVVRSRTVSAHAKNQSGCTVVLAAFGFVALIGFLF